MARERRLNLRLSEGEFRIILSAAAASGAIAGVYARDALLWAAAQLVSIDLQHEEDR